MREYIREEGEQAGAAHVARGRNHQHGNNLFRDDGLANRGNQIFDGNRTFAEKFLHHFVVALGDHLDEFFVRFLGFVHQRVGNMVNGGFAIAIRRVEMRFHGHQVDNSAKSLLASDRHLQRHYRAAKRFLQRFHRSLEAGQLAVHPGEHKGAGNIVFGAVIPNFFSGDLRAGVCVDGNERGIGGDQ